MAWYGIISQDVRDSGKVKYQEMQGSMNLDGQLCSMHSMVYPMTYLIGHAYHIQESW